jgi:protocatechuate 3,4-dioxygenase beta subunit
VGTGGAGTGGSGGSKPVFEDATSCTLTTKDIEGPFLIEEAEIPDDVTLVRSDIREGLPGCEFKLYFRLLNAGAKCAPIAGAEAYLWHCNAAGLYSGFGGQDPTKPYSGPANPAPQNLERFCRGIQTSDADGIVGFTTIYPGWYAGRPIHIHLMCRMPGATARLITTQLYFPAAFTTEVHESEPDYRARAAAMPAGSRNPPSGNPAMPTLKHTPGLVVGTLNAIVNGV